MSARRRHLAVFAFAIILAPLCLHTGCGEDGPGIDPLPPPTPPPFPGTPDQLLANWKDAYASMDFNHYRAVIHPDFTFIFSQVDIIEGLFPTVPLTRAGELAIAERMFSGRPGQSPGYGHPISPISSIQFTQWAAVDADWLPTVAGEPGYPACVKRVYDVRAEFYKIDTGRMTVLGQQQFFVAFRDSVVSGQTLQYHELRGWRDYSGGNLKSDESETWGGIKACWQ
jgi:hypothetical protein